MRCFVVTFANTIDRNALPIAAQDTVAIESK